MLIKLVQLHFSSLFYVYHIHLKLKKTNIINIHFILLEKTLFTVAWMLCYINKNNFDTSIISTELNMDIIDHNAFNVQTFKGCRRHPFLDSTLFTLIMMMMQVIQCESFILSFPTKCNEVTKLSNIKRDVFESPCCVWFY